MYLRIVSWHILLHDLVDGSTYLSRYCGHFAYYLWPITFFPHFVFLLDFERTDSGKIVLVILFPKDLKYHVYVIYLSIW